MSRIDDKLLLRRLRMLGDDALSGRQIGIEKECLRVMPGGALARTPHPAALGSALTHSWITTDYSESLLELVTPPQRRPWGVIQCLVDLHQFVYEQIGAEMLWATSMPCSVSRDEDIPIAAYGTSNVGMMKTVYRRGLGHRYGRLMQAIAGVHFNFSLGSRFWAELGEGEGWPATDAAAISAAYMGMLRNFRRYGWLTLYLFGASPAACSSFLQGRHTGFDEFESTVYGRYATSLRMSDVGYKNKVQSSLTIPVNSLDEYVDGLVRATNTVHPDYEEIGVLVDGEYRQLNANVLQIANEYYSLVRPKRIAWSGETPTHALRRGGIEYVEVRALDVSPFDPVGMNADELRFIEIMLLFCVLHDSPPIDAAEQDWLDRNQLAVAREGRNPALRLRDRDGERPLREVAAELCEAMAPVAEQLDAGKSRQRYAGALAKQQEAVADAERTPSAQVLREMRDNGESFFEFALRMSAAHREYFGSLVPINPERRRLLTEMATESIERQTQIEDADHVDFAEFLRQYFSPEAAM